MIIGSLIFFDFRLVFLDERRTLRSCTKSQYKTDPLQTTPLKKLTLKRVMMKTDCHINIFGIYLTCGVSRYWKVFVIAMLALL